MSRNSWCPYCFGNRVNYEIEMNNIHKYCNEKGGICNEVTFKGVYADYSCACKNGHNFKLPWNRAKYEGLWCTKCPRINPKDKRFDNIREYCLKHKGVCLEKEYKGYYSVYSCRCENGHVFDLNWGRSRKGWCQYCAGVKVNQKEVILYLRKYCKDRDGKLLEEEYLGSKEQIKCKCKNNHIFYLSYDEAKYKNKWCSYCSGRKHFFADDKITWLHQYCKSKKGKCNEYEFKGLNYDYYCNCKNGHLFKLKFSNAYNRKLWCPFCSGRKIDPFIIKDIKSYVENRNGKLIDTEYKGKNYKYKCICENNHEFYLNWNNAKNRGSWCKHCNLNFGEKLIYKVLKEITNLKFKTQVRFDSLRNPKTGMQLVCDFVCMNPKIIIEYNGKQHYTINSIYNKGKTLKQKEENLEYQKYRDSIKRKWAKSNGFIFIEIVQIKKLRIDNVKNILTKIFIENNIKLK